MAYYNKRIIRHQQVAFNITFAVVPSTVWLTPQPLGLLGIRGDIRHVKCRLEAGAPAGATLNLYIADKSLSDLTATPKDEDVFYANIGAALTASATAASIADNPGASGGALYEVAPLEGTDSNLAAGVEISAIAAGTYELLVDVWAEVQL